LVDPDYIPQRLRELSDPELDELGQFGSIMASEIVSRIQQLETKAIVVLGYDGAIIAFLLNLLVRPPYTETRSRVLLCIAALLAAISAFWAIYALSARTGWAWPSERDWFPEKAFGNLNAIKRRHLDALLNAHHQQGLRADRKGVALIWAQRLLIGSFLALLALFASAFIALYNFVGIAT
jgi:hypothetical protein